MIITRSRQDKDCEEDIGLMTRKAKVTERMKEGEGVGREERGGKREEERQQVSIAG